MEILETIIEGMNKEEVRFFKMFVNRVNISEERKTNLLFDYIRKPGKFNTDAIAEKLYPDGNRNPFYRLRNRVLDEITRSLTMQHFDDDELMYAYRLLALVKFFINRNQPEPAHYFLKRAEQKAAKTGNPELLDLIYSEFIRLSRELISVDPGYYIRKRKENLTQLSQLRQLDDVLAAVTYRLKVTQNYSSGIAPVLIALEKTISEFSSDKKLMQNQHARFKIYNAVSQVLLQKHQYKPLENYLLKTYKGFLRDKLFSRTNHDSRLQMLTYIVNTLYKNGKLQYSLQFAEELHSAMKEFDSVLYDKYLFYYYNSLVINYSQLNKAKAIQILEDLNANRKIEKNNFYKRFIYLNLFVLWFDLKDFHKAAKNLTRLYLIKDYSETDKALQLKIAVADIMTRYEINDFDTMQSKLKQIRREFREMLRGKEMLNEKEFLSVLDILCVSGKSGKKKSITSNLKKYIGKHSKNKEKEDTEIINYRHWLKEKMEILNV